jgi:hypothetical protein
MLLKDTKFIRDHSSNIALNLSIIYLELAESGKAALLNVPVSESVEPRFGAFNLQLLLSQPEIWHLHHCPEPNRKAARLLRQVDDEIYALWLLKNCVGSLMMMMKMMKMKMKMEDQSDPIGVLVFFFPFWAWTHGAG